jgi:uncharacterized protein (DUF1800 family)
MAHVADVQKRWDTDDRFSGVADASAFALAIEELAALARRPRWVAEDPQIHLEPHLRRASVPSPTPAGLGAGRCYAAGSH